MACIIITAGKLPKLFHTSLTRTRTYQLCCAHDYNIVFFLLKN
jgi:hypothetical protein